MSQLHSDTVQHLVRTYAGASPVTLTDVLLKRYGRDRVQAFIDRPASDAELGSFVEAAYEMIDSSWSSKGVELSYGPFVQSDD
jgi:hypothetical protein